MDEGVVAILQGAQNAVLVEEHDGVTEVCKDQDILCVIICFSSESNVQLGAAATVTDTALQWDEIESPAFQ